MAQFLDTNGLKTLINEIKTFVNNKFSKCATTLGVEAGQPITDDGVYNYLENNSNIASALKKLDGELKNVEKKINNSGGSVDLTDVNDRISKLEGVNDNAHELYNELMIFNNLLETQDFSNNWVCYDGGYNEIENGIESKSFNVPATTYNGLPVYGLSNKAYEDEALYIYSKQSLNITKLGKYVFSFYCDYYDTNTDDFNLTIGLWDESNNEYAKTITEDGVKIESTGSSYNGNLNLIKLNFEITEDDLSYFINDETNNPYDVCVKIEFNRNVGGGRLNFTPFMLHCVNQNQDLNEVLEPITSSIDALTYKVNTNITDITALKNNVSTNSVAINEHTSIIETLGNEENLENWKMYDYNGESYDFIDTGNEYNGLKVYKENIKNENHITHIESSQAFNVYKPGKYILYFYSQFNPQLDNVELKAKACIYSEGNVYCEGESVIIPINRNGYDLIKLQFEITQDDLGDLVDYINHIRIIIDNGSDENSTGIPLGAHGLMITPFILYGKNQDQDLNEVLEPITSNIDTLTYKVNTNTTDITALKTNVSTNSLAINEQKGMIDNIKESCCKLIHLNMDFSARGENFDQNAYVLPDDDLSNIIKSNYPIIAHISGSYDPAKAQGVNLTGGDEVLYKFETVTYINKLDDSAVAHVQGCLTDMAGGFPGIYSYYININLKEIGETPAGYWNVTNGGVKMF